VPPKAIPVRKTLKNLGDLGTHPSSLLRDRYMPSPWGDHGCGARRNPDGLSTSIGSDSQVKKFCAIYHRDAGQYGRYHELRGRLRALPLHCCNCLNQRFYVSDSDELPLQSQTVDAEGVILPAACKSLGS